MLVGIACGEATVLPEANAQGGSGSGVEQAGGEPVECDCPEPSPQWQLLASGGCEETEPDWFEATIPLEGVDVASAGARAYINEQVDGLGVVTKPIAFTYDGSSVHVVCGPISPFAQSVVRVWGFAP